MKKSLIDRILCEDVPLNTMGIGTKEFHMKPMRESVFVKIDNVVEYYFKISDKEYWHMNDFPNVRLPFNIMWTEYASPEYTNSGGRRIPVPERYSWGFLFQTPDLSQVPHSALDAERIPIVVNCYIELRGEVRLIGNDIYTIDGNGCLLPMRQDDGDSETKYFLLSIPREIAPDDKAVDLASNTILEGIKPAFLAISLMHCKNVAAKKSIYPDHEVREYRKRSGCSPKNFYTLEIDPMKHSAHVGSGCRDTGINRALHICRGHFKTFSGGNGLFGKYHGTYWWPQQVRGSAENGEIVKDYSVKAPKEDACQES